MTQRRINFPKKIPFKPHLTSGNGWGDEGGLPKVYQELLVQQGVDLGDTSKIKIDHVRPGDGYAKIGWTFRLHNKNGPQIRPWRGAIGVTVWDRTSVVGHKHLILGPFELDAKKIEEGATRSASNEAEIKAMWAVFEAWRDYQPAWNEEARDYR